MGRSWALLLGLAGWAGGGGRASAAPGHPGSKQTRPPLTIPPLPPPPPHRRRNGSGRRARPAGAAATWRRRSGERGSLAWFRVLTRGHARSPDCKQTEAKGLFGTVRGRATSAASASPAAWHVMGCCPAQLRDQGGNPAGVGRSWPTCGCWWPSSHSQSLRCHHHGRSAARRRLQALVPGPPTTALAAGRAGPPLDWVPCLLCLAVLCLAVRCRPAHHAHPQPLN